MPYCDDGESSTPDDLIEVIRKAYKLDLLTPAQMTRFLCRLMTQWSDSQGGRWRNLSNVRKVLAEVDREYCRRVIDPYEDKQKEKNGDLPEWI